MRICTFYRHIQYIKAMKITINEKANYMILAYRYAKHFINLYFTRRKRNPNNYTAINIKILSDCIAFDIVNKINNNHIDYIEIDWDFFMKWVNNL